MVEGFPTLVFRFACGICLSMRLFELAFGHPSRRVLIAYVRLYGKPTVFLPGCFNTKEEFIPRRMVIKPFWSRSLEMQ
jgi:hypothetical protein